VKRSVHYLNKTSGILKSSSSPKKATCLHSANEVLKLQLEILSHLLTTTFIARQLGLGLSLKLSKETQELLASQDRRQ